MSHTITGNKYSYVFVSKYNSVPGMGIVILELDSVGRLELINTSQWYTFPISLILKDGMMNESLYTDVEFMLLLDVTSLTCLTCVLLPVVHMKSTALVIAPTIIALHCNINGW